MLIIRTRQITKMQLANLLFAEKLPQIQIDGKFGYLQSIQREDGSGRSFNLTVRVQTALDTTNQVFHVRTTD